MSKCEVCNHQMVIAESCSCGNTQWSNFDNLVSNDTKVLDFVYERLTEVYGENKNVNYMSKFKDIIDTVKLGLNQTI
jgi:hypothetical protein